MKSKNSIIYLAEMLPILLGFLFFIYPDETLAFSHNPIGKFCIITIIMFYTCVHIIYGIFVCVLVILYYQSDVVEGFSPYPIEQAVGKESPKIVEFHPVESSVKNSVLASRLSTEELLFYSPRNLE